MIVGRLLVVLPPLSIFDMANLFKFVVGGMGRGLEALVAFVLYVVMFMVTSCRDIVSRLLGHVVMIVVTSCRDVVSRLLGHIVMIMAKMVTNFCSGVLHLLGLWLDWRSIWAIVIMAVCLFDVALCQLMGLQMIKDQLFHQLDACVSAMCVCVLWLYCHMRGMRDVKSLVGVFVFWCVVDVGIINGLWFCVMILVLLFVPWIATPVSWVLVVINPALLCFAEVRERLLSCLCDGKVVKIFRGPLVAKVKRDGAFWNWIMLLCMPMNYGTVTCLICVDWLCSWKIFGYGVDVSLFLRRGVRRIWFEIVCGFTPVWLKTVENIDGIVDDEDNFGEEICGGWEYIVVGKCVDKKYGESNCQYSVLFGRSVSVVNVVGSEKLNSINCMVLDERIVWNLWKSEFVNVGGSFLPFIGSLSYLLFWLLNLVICGCNFTPIVCCGLACCVLSLISVCRFEGFPRCQRIVDNRILALARLMCERGLNYCRVCCRTWSVCGWFVLFVVSSVFRVDQFWFVMLVWSFASMCIWGVGAEGLVWEHRNKLINVTDIMVRHGVGQDELMLLESRWADLDSEEQSALMFVTLLRSGGFSDCGSWCQISNFVGVLDSLVLCCCLVWFLLSYWWFLKSILKPLTVAVVVSCLFVTSWLPVSWFGCIISFTVIVSGVEVWWKGYSSIDVMSVILVCIPYGFVLTVLKWLFGVGVVLDSQWVMWVFLLGCSSGITLLFWLRSFDWAKYHVIIERDEDGRIVCKRVKFPLFASFVFGRVVGSIVGNLALVASKMGEAFINQDGIMRRFCAGLCLDGGSGSSFARQLLSNAQSQGTLDELLSVVNGEGEVSVNVLVGFKNTINPNWLGVIEVFEDGVWVPRGNGAQVRLGNGYGVITNAHVVCVVDKLVCVFCDGDDQSFEFVGKVRFNNGVGVCDLKLLSWNSKADLCILTGQGINDGFKIGKFVVGQNYIWAGVAPPLTMPSMKFMISVRPGPLGAVIGPISEKGDSGSVLIDGEGRIVAVKYGCSAVLDAGYGTSGFFVPLGCCENMDVNLGKMSESVEKVSASALVDVDKIGVDDYGLFCQSWLQLCGDEAKEMKEAFESKDKKKLSELLTRLGKRNVDVGAHVKLLSGKLLEAKAKNHFLIQQNLESEEKSAIRKQLDEVKAQIKTLVSLGEVWPEDDELVSLYKQKKQECEDLAKKLKEKYPNEDAKNRNKLLGSLGIRKHQLEKELKVEGLDDTEIADLRCQLNMLNDVKRQIVDLMSQGRDWFEDLSVEGKAVLSRMPDQLKRINYPFIYCDVDGKWHTWLSDNCEMLGDKHPSVDDAVLDKCSDYGLTLKQWKKKLQKSVVSEAWAKRVLKFVFQSEPSWLPRCMLHWVTRVGEVGNCDAKISCPWCGVVIVCDKKEHIGCSKYLTDRLDKHFGECKLNRISRGVFWYMGLPFRVEKNKIVVEGVKCPIGDKDHCCWKTKSELENEDKLKGKHSRYVRLYDEEGSVCLWVLRNCCDQMWKQHKISVGPSDKQLSEIVEKVEVKFMKRLDDEIGGIKPRIVDVERTLEKFGQVCDTFDKRFEGLSKKIDGVASNGFEVLNVKLDNLAKKTLVVEDLSSKVDFLKSKCVDMERKFNLLEEAVDSVSKVQEHVDNKLEVVSASVGEVVKTVDWVVESPLPPSLPVEENVVEVLPQRRRQDVAEALPQRRRQESKVKSSSGEFDKKQLFVGGGISKHSNLNGDCHCPRCQCDKNCDCDVCIGQACIWCNVVGHSVRDCKYAKERCCKKCNNKIDDWFGKTLVDRNRGRMGCKVLCCEEQTKCVVCIDGDHHGLSCPILRHSNLACNPETINTIGLNSKILGSLILPFENRSGVNGKKERKSRDPR